MKKLKSLIERLKNYSIKNNRRRILKNYYAKEIKKGKTYRASLLDKFLFRIMAFIFLGLYLYLKSSVFLLSFYMSAIFVYILTSTIAKFKKKKENARIKEIKEDLKKRRTIREISRLNRDGFIDYISSILGSYYGIELKKGNYFDLETTIEGEKYGIRCLKIGMDEKIVMRELENFIWNLRQESMDDGMLITNSYFRDDVEEDANIILHDLDSIILMLKDINSYPSDKEMEDYIIDRFLNRRTSIKKEVFDLNLKKSLQLYGLFVIFYLLSYYVRYSLYYKVIAILLFAIITMILGYKLSETIKEKDLKAFKRKN